MACVVFCDRDTDPSGIAEPCCALSPPARTDCQPPRSNSVSDVVRSQPLTCSTWTSQDPSTAPALALPPPVPLDGPARPAAGAVQPRGSTNLAGRFRHGVRCAPGTSGRVNSQVPYQRAGINENSLEDEVFCRKQAGFGGCADRAGAPFATAPFSPREGSGSRCRDANVTSQTACRAFHRREEVSSTG